jgi:hypothetical protein
MTDYRVPSLEEFEWQQPVLDKDLTTSPANTKGNRYIMAACGGDWAGSTPGYIATGTGVGSTWVYTTPTEGMMLWVADEDVIYKYNGSWSIYLSGSNTGDQTNISGNAATVTTNANLTGEVTSVGNSTTIIGAQEWTTWSPTWSSPSGTPPTYTDVYSCRYKVIGKICYWKIFAHNQTGGTAGNGTNGLQFTLPLAPANSYSSITYYIGSVMGRGYSYNDTGATFLSIYAAYSASTQTCTLFKITSDVALGQLRPNDQNATIREIVLDGWYEVA